VADKGETDSPRLTDAYVSKSLVADKIKALKTRKSTGPDNIPPKLLKLAGDAIVPSLLSQFRLSLNTSRVFTSWKTARLTPIYKKDDEIPRTLLEEAGPLAGQRPLNRRRPSVLAKKLDIICILAFV